MSDLLSFPNARCRDGYRILSFDRRAVNWSIAAEENGWTPAVKPEVDQEIKELVRKWGMMLAPEGDGRGYNVQLIIPNSARETRGDPLRQDPLLFHRYSEASGDEDAVLRLVSEHGTLISHKMPPFLDVHMLEIRALASAVKLLVEAEKTSKYEKFVKAYNSKMEAFHGPLSDGLIGWKLTLQNPPKSEIRACDLLSGLWLQMGMIASSLQGMRSCAYCGGWFVFGTGTGRRSSAAYCDKACTMAHFRVRKKQASELSGQNSNGAKE